MVPLARPKRPVAVMCWVMWGRCISRWAAVMRARTRPMRMAAAVPPVAMRATADHRAWLMAISPGAAVERPTAAMPMPAPTVGASSATLLAQAGMGWAIGVTGGGLVGSVL